MGSFSAFLRHIKVESNKTKPKYGRSSHKTSLTIDPFPSKKSGFLYIEMAISTQDPIIIIIVPNTNKRSIKWRFVVIEKTPKTKMIM